jgi:hypothetical protein
VARAPRPQAGRAVSAREWLFTDIGPRAWYRTLAQALALLLGLIIFAVSAFIVGGVWVATTDRITRG